VLDAIQPANGGFLEATPLTSFVTMSIASMGASAHPVAVRGAAFLRTSVRDDGSWPIDTNLSTWLTTLSLKALRHVRPVLSPEVRQTVRKWLLAQQFNQEHPYTHAAPGGWAWTDLPGGVPDADDTAGALLALLECGVVDTPTRDAGVEGVRWLLDLQNRDGGIPTFCRGWGALPFDRSGSDLTAHALRAWSAWQVQLPDRLKHRVDRAITRGVRYLQTARRSDGTWLPLWFGNEHGPSEENPTYGTAHVLIALRELHARGFSVPAGMIEQSAQWLADAQHESGGWGGFAGSPASIEETGAAVEALAGFNSTAVQRGAAWLARRVENGTWRAPAPIGFYFAKLWYSERLYPLIFAVAGLAAAAAYDRD
jgi:squalene-hopene/tetraprenyl-beta-curcumene cyclase